MLLKGRHYVTADATVSSRDSNVQRDPPYRCSDSSRFGLKAPAIYNRSSLDNSLALIESS